MGKSRLDEISCAICYDPLFTLRDDLDDLVPIATCDCGHVFHEPCVLKWFTTQSEAYLASARERDQDGRYGSPSLSDAPAECPTCRTEVYADPETGQPSIHRLFIDFSESSNNSHYIGSSPPPSSWSKYFSRKGKEKEKEVLGLARRAKGIGEEVKGLNADSEEEEMEGMIRRGEGLVADLVGEKVLGTVQNYIDALTKELKTLHQTLQTNPLIPNLRAKLAEKETELTNLHRQSRLNAQREIKKVKEEEQARCERRVKKAEEERDLIKREYEREKVQRKAGLKAMEERENDTKRRLEEITEQLKKEKEDRRSKETTLQERNKQLKMFQKKVEDRKELKARIAALEADNARLRSSMYEGIVPSDVEDLKGRGGDTSIQEISETYFPSSSRSRTRNGRHSTAKMEEDDSLQIEMPSFHDDSFRSPNQLLPSRTTMRNLDSTEFDRDQDEDDSPSKHTRQKQRMHPTARTIAVDYKAERRRSSSSKYFPGEDEKENEYSRYSGGVKKGEDGPSPPKRSKTNPFVTTKASNERRKELPSLGQMSTSTSTSSDRKGAIGRTNQNQGWNDVSIIDLATESSSNESSPRRPVVRKREQQRSVVDMLGLADGMGRPRKGVVSGQKVRRKF
ncbi:hypothetical protein I302_101344 [Kwoniella bestiolae CBS 10118]|uniref:RING-type domain-containing protein n=1 Tax=Kwoniella bestiolae CBS 10118 TaxID=1296100 RepID=A0A1B9GBZ2_9TREE|nr:hypothetical protein I302_00027 [Kwoniella bestiolae CBS 10118]OCF28540.1 hypothetical protein I302_00027 [Kwoniella bestiolae CBS 10118]